MEDGRPSVEEELGYNWQEAAGGEDLVKHASKVTIEDINSRFVRNQVELPHGKIFFRDLIPDYPRQDEDVPLITTPGYGMDQHVIGTMTAELVAKGEHIIPLDYVGGTNVGDHIADFLDYMTVLYPDKKQFDYLGQSDAIVEFGDFARRYPEKLDMLRNIIFVSPMGMKTDESLGDIMFHRRGDETRRNKKVNQKREAEYLKEMEAKGVQIQQGNLDKFRNLFNRMRGINTTTALPPSELGEAIAEDKATEKRVTERFIANLASHPLTSIQEARQMGNAYEYPTLELLKKAGKRVAIIQGEDDLLAKNEDLWERFGEGSESVWKTLTQEEFDSDPRYGENGIKVGATVWDSSVSNQVPYVDSLEISGGHEIMGQRSFAQRVIATKDYLNNPIDPEEAAINARHNADKAQEKRRVEGGELPSVPGRELYSPDFLEKFQKVFRVDTPDGTAVYRNVEPYTKEVGEDGKIEAPIIFLSGFAMGGRANKPLMNEFYQNGAQIIPIDNKGTGTIKSLFGSEIARQARVVGKVVDQLPYEKVRILTESISSLVLDELIKQRPDLLSRIESTLLVAPIGLGGKDNLKDFLDRNKKEGERIDNTQTPQEARAGKIYGKEYSTLMKKHPIRFLKQVGAMAFANRDGLVKSLVGHNIPVGIMVGQEDQLISTDRVTANMQQNHNSVFTSSEVDPEDWQPLFDEEQGQARPVVITTPGGHEKLGSVGYALGMLKAFRGLKQQGDSQRDGT